MQVSARTSHAAWWSFLTERRPDKLAVRRSTALALTATDSNHAGSSATPGLRRRLWPAAAIGGAIWLASFTSSSRPRGERPRAS